MKLINAGCWQPWWPRGLVARRRARAAKPPSARTSPSACRSSRKIDEVTQVADARAVRGARRHRHLLHRRRGQLPDPGQPDRREGAQRNLTEERVEKLQRDRLRQAAAEGRLQDRARQRQAQAGGVRRPELRLLQAASSATCRRSTTSRSTSSSTRCSGPDSNDKSRNIWCAKDKAKAWNDWMVRDVKPRAPARAATAPRWRATSSSASKYNITGTPTLIFADGTRVPGAIPAAQVEKQLGRRQADRQPRRADPHYRVDVRRPARAPVRASP